MSSWKKSANIIPERTGANENAIKLEKDKQLSYRHIYSLKPVKFKILKTYIKTNLANNFIKALKSSVAPPIFFIYKLNNRFCLYANYWRLKNLTIKNQYPLPLIGESLNQLS